MVRLVSTAIFMSLCRTAATFFPYLISIKFSSRIVFSAWRSCIHIFPFSFEVKDRFQLYHTRNAKHEELGGRPFRRREHEICGDTRLVGQYYRLFSKRSKCEVFCVHRTAVNRWCYDFPGVAALYVQLQAWELKWLEPRLNKVWSHPRMYEKCSVSVHIEN